MCTAISFKNGDTYFGRTLDLEYHYNEEVVITPRNYTFNFRHTESVKKHFAIIGIATVEDNYPLYYDAVNEKGLCAAGLNFPKSAVYSKFQQGHQNVAVFEFIPFILSKFKSVSEVKDFLSTASITDSPFNEKFPTATLHWLISDREGSITVESTEKGLNVYDNPIGVLTNEPEFPYQLLNLANYMNLTSSEPSNNFSENVDIQAYSRGMGAVGLPGDNSSTSRFVRASFMKLNSRCGVSESDNVNQFFHILGSVNQIKGSVRLKNGKDVYTVYTSCCNTDKMIFYYTTYDNSQITAVKMNNADIDSDNLIRYLMIDEFQIKYHN